MIFVAVCGLKMTTSMGHFVFYIKVPKFSTLKFILKHMYLNRYLAKFGHLWLTLADWLHNNAYSGIREPNNYLPNEGAQWVLFKGALGHQISPN